MEKYRWENQSKEFKKELNVNMKSIDTVFSYGSNYHLARNVDLDAYMVINNSGTCFMLKNK